mmetsp:Transcript_14627/g.14252  ORF Transcript_14627/g.14252 Transcript_14627/m.14252 type:complete len:177 (+) Transcript_14627:1963-2493(+)
MATYSKEASSYQLKSLGSLGSGIKQNKIEELVEVSGSQASPGNYNTTSSHKSKQRAQNQQPNQKSNQTHKSLHRSNNQNNMLSPGVASTFQQYMQTVEANPLKVRQSSQGTLEMKELEIVKFKMIAFVKTYEMEFRKMKATISELEGENKNLKKKMYHMQKRKAPSANALIQLKNN